MKGIRTRRGRLVLVVFIVAALAAGLSVTAASASKKSNITLTIDVFGDFGYHALYTQYEASHPGITIKEDTEDYAPHHTALAQHLATGAGADDIEAIEVGFIGTYTAQPRYFVDLRKYGASGLKSRYPAWKWQQAVASNKSVIGLGTDVGSLGICYRTDLFKKAGLPTSPAKVAKLWPTWSDFLAVGKRFEKHAPSGVKFIDSGSNLFNAIMGQANPGYYSKSGKVIAATNPKIKAAWNLTMQAVKQGEDKGLTAFAADWNAGFKTGAFATVTCPAWMMGYIQGQAPNAKGKWNIAAVPGGGGNWGGSFLTVTTQSQHPTEAAALVKFLTSPASETYVFKHTGNLSSEIPVLKSAAVQKFRNPYFSNAPVGKIFAGSALKLKPQVLGPHQGDFQTAATNAIQRVEQHSQSPGAAWKQFLKDVANASG
ncbi:MAG TPA: ABC transporter substrate-binding protein [Thermoanaerobaculia bacterium]|nr:ABC transporter substrate-binding protein [Thermoanaerobaculia bacterium]